MTKRPSRKGKTGICKSIGYGWVGRWNDDTLGWFMPARLTGHSIDAAAEDDYNKGEKAFLCKITIEQVIGADGREICRTVPTDATTRNINKRAATTAL